VEQAAPRRIGVDVSRRVALADGLAHTDRELLVSALGPWAQRLVPAERLVVGWLETRLPEELDAMAALGRATHELIAEAFSPDVVRPGRTTAADLGWWLRQRATERGLAPWFHPVVAVQRAGVPLTADRLPAVPAREPIRPGDLLSCDVGLTTLGLCSDIQRCAYVLASGEASAPPGLRTALSVANRLQELTVGELRPGRTGDEVLAAARSAAAAEGIEAIVYSHPIGTHGHGAGPAIGLWDRQDGVPGAGELPVHADTAWALELAVRTAVPEWDDQVVRLPLEEGIALTADGADYLTGRQTELVLV
jgi:Xaa-Pro aminopeptidase